MHRDVRTDCEQRKSSEQSLITASCCSGSSSRDRPRAGASTAGAGPTASDAAPPGIQRHECKERPDMGGSAGRIPLQRRPDGSTPPSSPTGARSCCQRGARKPIARMVEAACMIGRAQPDTNRTNREPAIGLEPMTYRLQGGCATNCATPAKCWISLAMPRVDASGTRCEFRPRDRVRR